MGKKIEIGKIFALCVGCYYIVLRYVFPGYFSPLIPHHGDYYSFLSTFNTQMNWLDAIRQPRFIGTFVLNSFSQIGLKGLLLFVIILTLINLCLLVYLFCNLKKMGDVSILSVLIFFTLIFSHPGFYFNYSYDNYSTIALFFLLVSLLLWNHWKDNITFGKYLLIALLIACSFFSKETYVITAIAFFFFEGIRNKFVNGVKINVALRFFYTVIFIIGLSFLFNNLMSSPWTDVGAIDTQPYYINLNPISIFKTYMYYLSAVLTLPLVVYLLIIFCYCYISKKNMYLFCLFICLGLAVIVPYSLLPNHKLDAYYSFLAAPFFYGTVFLINWKEIIMALNKNNKKINDLIFGGIIAVIFVVMIPLSWNYYGQNVYPKYSWLLEQEKINKNILTTLPKLGESIMPSERVLVAGLYFPFHPFGLKPEDTTKDYINVTFKKNGNVHWVLLNTDFAKQTESGLYNYVGTKWIDINAYDRLVVYNSRGELELNIANSEFKSLLMEKGNNNKIDFLVSKLSNVRQEVPTLLLISKFLLYYDNIEKANSILDDCVNITEGNDIGSLYLNAEAKKLAGNSQEAIINMEKVLELSKGNAPLEKDIEEELFELKQD